MQGDGTKRRHSWGSLAAGAEVEGADAAAAAAERRGPDSLHLPARRAHEEAEDSSSEDDDRSDDEWSGHKCLDLLETCWGLERARLLRDEEDGGVSETESEPGPERGELESSGMGQRASSTSSLHVKPPTTTAPGRVSLTWALLKRQPSVHLAQPQHPVVVQRRASPARSAGRASSRTQTLCPDSDEDTKTPVSQSAGSHVSRHRSHRNSDSSSLVKHFGYDIHDVDEFLSKFLNVEEDVRGITGTDIEPIDLRRQWTVYS
ncbi:hypothetical protein B566_EDAN015478 [Ephemera danica]|nr:hypothetical protein B566_EDAN015478 [Ephemera danica]